MQFLKKHYEKIILSVVLLGLAAAAFWLSIAVKDAQGKTTFTTEPAQKTAWVPIDLSKERAALGALHTPVELELSGAHNLFNPVTWKRIRGRLVKVLVEGAAALTVTDIRPLYYQIIFDSKVGDGYYMVVEPPPPARKVRQFYALNDKDKTKPFVIVGTNDATDGTPTLQLHLNDTDETVTVTAKNPYKRVDSYETDLKYMVDSTAFNRKRAGETIPLSETVYKIIAITTNAVTVQDTKISKKTTIQWIAAH